MKIRVVGPDVRVNYGLVGKAYCDGRAAFVVKEGQPVGPASYIGCKHTERGLRFWNLWDGPDFEVERTALAAALVPYIDVEVSDASQEQP